MNIWSVIASVALHVAASTPLWWSWWHGDKTPSPFLADTMPCTVPLEVTAVTEKSTAPISKPKAERDELKADDNEGEETKLPDIDPAKDTPQKTEAAVDTQEKDQALVKEEAETEKAAQQQKEEEARQEKERQEEEARQEAERQAKEKAEQEKARQAAEEAARQEEEDRKAEEARQEAARQAEEAKKKAKEEAQRHKKEAEQKAKEKALAKKAEQKKKDAAKKAAAKKKETARDRVADLLDNFDKKESKKAKKSRSQALRNVDRSLRDGGEAETPITDPNSTSEYGAEQVGPAMSISIMDRVKRALERAWRVPSNLHGQPLAVVVTVYANPDGTVQKAVIQDKEGTPRHPAYALACQSALRAIELFKTRPLPFEPAPYHQWRVFSTRFGSQ